MISICSHVHYLHWQHEFKSYQSYCVRETEVVHVKYIVLCLSASVVMSIQFSAYNILDMTLFLLYLWSDCRKRNMHEL